MAIKCVANGVFTFGEVINLLAPGNDMHLVLLPMGEPGAFEFIQVTAGVSEMVQTDGETPLTHCIGAGAVQIRFHTAARKVDTCLSVALKGAVRCLQVDDATKPRVGALNVSDLCAAVTDIVGDDRAALRFDDRAAWLSGLEEIAAFSPNDAETTTACVAKKSCHRWAGGRAARTVSDLDFAAMVRIANSDAMGWRRLAASFSTMMRYLQKLKADFCWSTGGGGAGGSGRTTIRLVRGTVVV
jgi:hypothetical protein